MMRLGSDSVMIYRAQLAASDRYGKQARDWSNPAATTVRGVSVQPVSAAEAVVDREYALSHMVMYAPPGTNVVATDRVAWRGLMFEVDGPPQPWVDDFGQLDHVEVSLKLMSG